MYLRMTTSWIERNYRRMQARTVGQIVRGASLRVWPLSRMVHSHYRARMAPKNWSKTNARALRNLAVAPPQLDLQQQRAVSGLRNDGFFKTTVGDFLNDAAVLDEIRRDAEALLVRPRVQRQLENRHSTEGIKWYVVRAFGYRPSLPVPTSFAKLLLNERILSVVNSYLGVTSRLKYLDVWHNFQVDDSEPPIDAEKWHRDNEDRKLIKLFFHLSDVDDTAGPLTYVRGSQPDGPLGDLFPNNPPQGSYPPAQELESVVSPDLIEPNTGDSGTILLFDACGLHRGGRTRGKSRTLLVATYASDAALDLLQYELVEPQLIENLSHQARYAIHAPTD
jgi:hypothetical protein